MEASGGLILYPTSEDIIVLNRTLIEESESGLQSPDLVRDRGTIDWAINDVQGLGYDACETLIDKAALLAWRIIARHPFRDGNKRTGMGVALAFLVANNVGYDVTDDSPHGRRGNGGRIHQDVISTSALSMYSPAG